MEKRQGIVRFSGAGRGLTTGALVVALAALMVIGAAGPARAQFDSGSSGVHGVFPPEPTGGSIPSNYTYLVWNIRTGGVRYCSSYTLGTGLDTCGVGSGVDVFAQIPGIPNGGLTTGVYEFQSFMVPAVDGLHRYIVPVGGTPNTPLSILSQTDIDLPGNDAYQTIMWIRGWDGLYPGGITPAYLAVVGGKGGPGGFDGGASGNGGATPGNGSAGYGPVGGAGGLASATTLMELKGELPQATPLNPSLTPLSGGSGGGAGAGVGNNQVVAGTNCGNSVAGFAGGSGGGGGGALLLAANGMVRLGPRVFVWAQGGAGGYNGSSGCPLLGAGGAGGSVRIVANQFAGSATINLTGGVRSDGIASPGGLVRIETNSNTYTGTISGASGGSFISFPTAPLPAILPTLRITAVNGTNAPASPSASLATPDITFATAVSTVTLDVAASNVPLGTTVNIKVVPATGAPTTATTTGLTGTVADAIASATVTLPPGAGVITASATFNAGSLSSLNLPLIDGEKPEQVEVMAMADGTSRTFLIGRSGARFELGRATN